MRSLITVQQRSENGYGLQRQALKTGAMENGIFWSEIGSGFVEPEHEGLVLKHNCDTKS